MKIFNNFDTNLIDKEYSYAIQKHGKDNVILIQRAFAFWVINWIIPFFIFSVMFMIFSFLYFQYIKDYNFPFYIFIWFSVLLIFFVLRYLTNRYLDYKYDFTIITHEWVFTFKQLWFFNSKNKDLPASKIRSISCSRDWLLWNIFWYWNIEIITDWSLSSVDDEWSHLWWKMIMTYVKKSNLLRKKIIEVCLIRK